MKKKIYITIIFTVIIFSASTITIQAAEKKDTTAQIKSDEQTHISSIKDSIDADFNYKTLDDRQKKFLDDILDSTKAQINQQVIKPGQSNDNLQKTSIFTQKELASLAFINRIQSFNAKIDKALNIIKSLIPKFQTDGKDITQITDTIKTMDDKLSDSKQLVSQAENVLLGLKAEDYPSNNKDIQNARKDLSTSMQDLKTITITFNKFKNTILKNNSKVNAVSYPR